MKRRDALKNIGLTLGYAAITPSALSILQSCTTEAEKWTPKLLSPDEGIIVENLIDLMLPKTESSPGALQVNVPEFIDLLAFKSYTEEAKTKFMDGIKAIIEKLTLGKDPEFQISDLKTEEYDALLSEFLKTDLEDRQGYDENEKIIYSSLAGLRGRAIWAFKNSEEIGENILAYNPIPGKQKGCIDANKASNGKSWSLQS